MHGLPLIAIEFEPVAEMKSPGVEPGLNRNSKAFLAGLLHYFMRSNVFCKICQGSRPLTFSCIDVTMLASFTFFVGLLTL